MSLHEKYLRVFSGLIPVGAVGIALILGLAAPSDADDRPTDMQSPEAGSVRIAERLAAIREAVSAIVASEAAAKIPGRLAWGNVMGNSRWPNSWGNIMINNWGNNWLNNWGNNWRNYWNNH
jgi:hypothetical protein